MARLYDIAERIANANQKPTVKIDDEHEFTIKCSKTNALLMMAMYEEADDKNSPELLNKLIINGLGQKAYEYIESLELMLPAYEIIVNVIMAAFQDISLEDLEKEVEKKESPEGKK